MQMSQPLHAVQSIHWQYTPGPQYRLSATSKNVVSTSKQHTLFYTTSIHIYQPNSSRYALTPRLQHSVPSL